MKIDRGCSYGWRARIGFIAPRHVLDVPIREFYRIAPEGVAMVVTLLGMRELTQDVMDSALERLVKTAEVFKDYSVDVIVQAGVPYVVHKPFGYHKEIAEAVTSATGIPYISDIEAVLKAINTLSAKKVAMVTPFTDEVCGKVQRYLEQGGIEIVYKIGLDIKHTELPLVSPADIYGVAKEALLRTPSAEALYIPVGGWLVSDNIERLERDFGIPVVYAMQSMIWASLRLVGIKTKIQGFGRLLTEY